MQVGLAVVLLVQISLFARTAWNFGTMENGFDPQSVLTFRVELPEAKYADEESDGVLSSLLTRIDGSPTLCRQERSIAFPSRNAS